MGDIKKNTIKYVLINALIIEAQCLKFHILEAKLKTALAVFFCAKNSKDYIDLSDKNDHNRGRDTLCR